MFIMEGQPLELPGSPRPSQDNNILREVGIGRLHRKLCEAMQACWGLPVTGCPLRLLPASCHTPLLEEKASLRRRARHAQCRTFQGPHASCMRAQEITIASMLRQALVCTPLSPHYVELKCLP